MEVKKVFSETSDKSKILEHYGVLGMKWGIRRYQPYSVRGRKSGEGGKEIGEAKKSGKSLFKQRAENRRIKKQAEAKQKAKQLKRERQKEKAEHERRKQEALKSGSARKLKPYVRELSDKQLSDALNRIQNERKLSELSAAEKRRGEAKVDDAMRKIGKYTEWANKGITAWNTVAKIHNTFNEDQVPVIDGVYRKKK